MLIFIAVLKLFIVVLMLFITVLLFIVEKYYNKFKWCTEDVKWYNE